MAKSFLTVIEQRKRKELLYAGSRHGGATGHDGSGFPLGNPGNFMFATGIECSYPTIHQGKTRRDQLRECDHYIRWKEDLHLVKEMGLRVLRYGLPYYSIHKGPGRYDWSFADEVMQEIKKLRITPILDLMHFGVPDWIGNFQNPDLPLLFAKYAAAVAKRYPWVRFYTPVNEIFISARMSGRDGYWNEQLKTDRGFVTALKNLVAASILATHQIARHRSDCIIVQSESAEYIHEATTRPSREVTLMNKLRFLALDLLYGHTPDSDVCMYLTDNGMTRKEYEWFISGEPPGYHVMGNDYYGRNEVVILPDKTSISSMDILGWYHITKDYYQRYHKPVMHTETNVFDPEQAVLWLWKQWINVLEIRKEGVPVLGFTWYSLIDQVDWDTGLAVQQGHVNACGLYDLDRKPRPVAAAYKALLQEFGQITIVPYAEMLELTNRAARLKVDV